MKELRLEANGRWGWTWPYLWERQRGKPWRNSKTGQQALPCRRHGKQDRVRASGRRLPVLRPPPGLRRENQPNHEASFLPLRSQNPLWREFLGTFQWMSIFQETAEGRENGILGVFATISLVLKTCVPIVLFLVCLWGLYLDSESWCPIYSNNSWMKSFPFFKKIYPYPSNLIYKVYPENPVLSSIEKWKMF